MRFPSRTLSLLALTALMAVMHASPALSGRLYKWVDDEGQIHYGDKVPPQYAKKERKRLNQQGITVDTKARAKTPEELAEQRRLARLAEEEEARRQEQVNQDKILLDTFSNEDEMVMTRNGKIDAVDATIRITNTRIEKLKARLDALTRRAAQQERGGQAVSDTLHQDIATTKQQIRDNEQYIRQKQREQQAIRDKFEADILRFRELQVEIERKKREAAEQNG